VLCSVHLHPRFKCSVNDSSILHSGLHWTAVAYAQSPVYIDSVGNVPMNSSSVTHLLMRDEKNNRMRSCLSFTLSGLPCTQSPLSCHPGAMALLCNSFSLLHAWSTSFCSICQCDILIYWLVVENVLWPRQFMHLAPLHPNNTVTTYSGGNIAARCHFEKKLEYWKCMYIY